MNKACCFTGHRPFKFSFKTDESARECIEIKKRIKDETLRLIEEKEVKTFYGGMALGVDTWAAECVIEIKKDIPDIRLVAAVPYAGHSDGWSKVNQERYDNIIKNCDDVVVLTERWSSWCMMTRNRYMVDHSDYVIAVWNGEFTGGTGKTVEYALKQEKEPIVIRF